MSWTLAADVGGPLAGAVAVVWAAFVDRRAKHRTAEAANTAAVAAEDSAKAEMRKAVVAEREQQAANWAKITEGMQRWNEQLAERLGEVEQRLGDAEIRSSAAEIKATTAEKNYRIAIAYLRRVIHWVNDNWPGNDCPEPPPELASDL